jgi:acyl-CoA reductase-like NAD-dependent aldehyde dehydrogenase
MGADATSTDAPGPGTVPGIEAPTGLLISGQWVEGSAGDTIAVDEPAQGTTLAEVAAATVTDVDAAVEAARYGAEAMEAMPPFERVGGPR